MLSSRAVIVSHKLSVLFDNSHVPGSPGVNLEHFHWDDWHDDIVLECMISARRKSLLYLYVVIDMRVDLQ